MASQVHSPALRFTFRTGMMFCSFPPQMSENQLFSRLDFEYRGNQ